MIQVDLVNLSILKDDYRFPGYSIGDDAALRALIVAEDEETLTQNEFVKILGHLRTCGVAWDVIFNTPTNTRTDIQAATFRQ